MPALSTISRPLSSYMCSIMKNSIMKTLSMTMIIRYFDSARPAAISDGLWLTKPNISQNAFICQTRCVQLCTCQLLPKGNLRPSFFINALPLCNVIIKIIWSCGFHTVEAFVPDIYTNYTVQWSTPTLYYANGYRTSDCYYISYIYYDVVP